MPVEIIRLFGFDGPNIRSPYPGVLLTARSTGNVAAALRDAMKAGGQQVGMVIASLDVVALPRLEELEIVATFVTPTPTTGVDLVRYVVEGLNARETGDEDWDAEEPLWLLQRRQRAEALPIAALQLVAEANRRGVPAFRRADGLLQFGYGARGTTLDVNLFAADPFAASAPPPAALELPWQRLGPIPILATCGGVDSARLAMSLADMFGSKAELVTGADFDAARTLLCQPHVELAIIDLEPRSLLVRGLPFDQCSLSAVAVVPHELAGAIDRSEIAQAVALPMLVTVSGGHAVLNAAFPELARLAVHASCQVTTTHDMLATARMLVEQLFGHHAT